jgi:UDP-N-acetylglucosamine--N-acetylmuramyl-(pentapeptide) pyrophosphoryl-undecaprenol N-acetylglucosamine transferase
MKNHGNHIVFSGGGTAGHLFPGLAVADRLAATIPHMRITFCGGGKPFERQAVADAGYEYLALPARPLPHGPRDVISFLFENMAGYLAARRFLQEENVSAVVGLGGYASVPMARAAARRHVPLVLLEQNVIPGRATRWLSRHASLVCTAFQETAKMLRCPRPIRITGNPIRAGFREGRGASVVGGQWSLSGAMPRATVFTNLQSPIPNPQSPVSQSHLLVLGGSGGARSLNENVPKALYKIRRQLSNWQIVHQSGEADREATESLYRKFDVPAVVMPFVGDMPGTLGETDLVVCRAGGTTLAELAVMGVPAVLLPYPHAADNHQAANARHFSAGGGCVTIDERQISDRLDDRLADMLCFLLANDDLRRRMSASMLELAMPSATADVAELVWSTVSSRSLQTAAA